MNSGLLFAKCREHYDYDMSKITNNSSGNEQQLIKILCGGLEIHEFSCSLIQPLKYAVL